MKRGLRFAIRNFRPCRPTSPVTGARTVLLRCQKSVRLLALLAPLLAILLLAAGCRLPQSQSQIEVHIQADGEKQTIQVEEGSTVAEALRAAGLEAGSLDRLEPPSFQVLQEGDTIRLIRVQESFETKQTVIPFERQIVRSESLPEGETRLIQPGVNGLAETTYRRLIEDDVEVSNTPVKTVILQEAVPEIVMTGTQAAYAPLEIPGRIAYLIGGNAWLMEGSTANRRPLVTSGDLDGRVFSLSPKGDWLLFSRKSDKPLDQEINTLWAVSTINANAKPIDLGISNIIHFAAWVPGQVTVVSCSTVEPRTTAPGWQANNDLLIIDFGETGWVNRPEKVVEANAGGIYGWWGTAFAWSNDGKRLAYARPDGVGLVEIEKGTFQPLADITPLQTRSDWAWIPGLAWGSDSRTLYYLYHAPPPSLISPEESPYFDLYAVSLTGGANVRLLPQTGMFAAPAVSPSQPLGNELGYQVAYLQAIFPAQSNSSRYRLVVMDRDGSNRRTLFPPTDAPGLEPQTPVWSPLDRDGKAFLAVLYDGNLWLIESASGAYRQVTGDGLIGRIDWK